MKFLTTPNARYFVHRERLWRCTNPPLDEETHQRLVKELRNKPALNAAAWSSAGSDSCSCTPAAPMPTTTPMALRCGWPAEASRGGISVGATDELGAAAVEDRYHVKNLHATVLHQLGIDPNKLTYFHGGLDQKLVGVEGAEPISQIIQPLNKRPSLAFV